MKKFLILFLLVSPINGQEPVVPVIDIPYVPTETYRDGWEERGEQWAKWLSPSVMVTSYNGGGGSGTICHYDGEYAYVISCGHLYPSGRRSFNDLKDNPIYKKITVFYHNEKKLDSPREYKGETLCYVQYLRNNVYDVSLLRFKPDWDNPWVVPIAPIDYKLEKNKYYHSCGCDGLTPVAHYLVRYLSEDIVGNISQIITTDNNPRGGRSGGGVMTDDGKLLFICSRGGGGYAYWTSLKQIHNFLNEEKFSFVLNNFQFAQKLPIIDKIGPSKEYPKDFILIPNQSR